MRPVVMGASHDSWLSRPCHACDCELAAPIARCPGTSPTNAGSVRRFIVAQRTVATKFSANGRP